MTDRATLV